MTTAIILAAGYGERLKPLTFSMPKPLVKIMGKPIIKYLIDELMRCGINDFVVVIGPYSTAIKDYLEREGIETRYAYQPMRLGVADAIMRGIDAGVSEPVITLFADNYFSEGLCGFVRSFMEDRSYDAYIVLASHKHKERFGNVIIKDGKVREIIEKPKEPPKDSFVLTGLMAFRNADVFIKAFTNIKPSPRNEYEITDVLRMIINNNGVVKYVISSGWWKDMGTYDDLLELMQLLIDSIEGQRIEGTVTGNVVGRVIIEKGAVVEGSVYGPAYIGAGAYVGRHASIEHFVDLEGKSQVISGRVTRSIIYDESTIDLNQGVLMDSVVGPQSTVKVSNTKLQLLIGEKSVVAEPTI